MNTNQHEGDVTNFGELLSNHKIEIPIIQRDYSQGRKDKEEIRSNFLNALFESISEHHPIKLDFIYGNLEAGISHPLDGQQRLTTLFLLHWYAAVKEQILNKDNIEILKKFTYETRISSREFCHSLVSNKINFQDESNPSEYIIDSSWFFLSWKKDPTIDSMLRTIDSIHEIFHDVDDLWERLTGDENLISFYHIELEGIGLTDDLYIKMNARGKLLSSFSIDDLKMVYKVIVANFNHDSDVSNLMRRALLTIQNEDGKFSYYECWWSFWNVVSANKRCLIDGTLRALEFYIYGNNGEYSIYLKNLINRLKDDDLQGIIDKFEAPEDMPNWKVRLIKEPNLLDDNCKSNHLAIPSDESSCFLLKSMRPRDIDGCFEVK